MIKHFIVVLAALLLAGCGEVTLSPFTENTTVKNTDGLLVYSSTVRLQEISDKDHNNGGAPVDEGIGELDDLTIFSVASGERIRINDTKGAAGAYALPAGKYTIGIVKKGNQIVAPYSLAKSRDAVTFTVEPGKITPLVIDMVYKEIGLMIAGFSSITVKTETNPTIDKFIASSSKLANMKLAGSSTDFVYGYNPTFMHDTITVNGETKIMLFPRSPDFWARVDENGRKPAGLYGFTEEGMKRYGEMAANKKMVTPEVYESFKK